MNNKLQKLKKKGMQLSSSNSIPYQRAKLTKMQKIESFFVLFLILGSLHFPRQGFCNSRQNHLESKKQSELLKNGVLKTFRTNNGDVIECVNIHKQPAFKHPLLKNHTLQWEPKVVPKEMNIETLKEGDIAINLDLSDRCPPAYIPVRKHHILKTTQDLHYQFAIVKMIRPKDERFYGARTYISINNPTCRKGQNSGASIWIGSDLSDQKNFIKAGWMVYPEVYGDSLTHFSIYWTGDGFHKTGCYDLQCPGFVQVNKDIVVGAPFSNISKHGELAFENYYYVFQDRETQNWWLTFGTTRSHAYVGYWPKELFPRFGGGATILHFGGSVMTRAGQEFPSMGDGFFPTGNPMESNYFRLIQYVNDSNYLISPPKLSAKISIDDPKCYGLIYDENGNKDFQHGLYMGGPGGAC